MTCPRCGTKIDSLPCPNCGFPVMKNLFGIAAIRRTGDRHAIIRKKDKRSV